MNKEPNTVIHSFYQLTNQCKYHELECCIIPENDVYIDGWIGACLRNNLLREAEYVNVTGPLSLLDIINVFPLKKGHPLYKELQEGFPKGYSLHVVSPSGDYHSCTLKKDEPFRFSLVLHGYFADYYTYFITAIQSLCRKGFGHPEVSFRLIDISECDQNGRLHSIYSSASDTVSPLEHPVSLSDFRYCKMGEEEKELEIGYDSPIHVYNELRTVGSDEFKNRQHEFPGFYPLVRAAVNRVVKMMILYHKPKEPDYPEAVNPLLPSFLQYAVTPILTSAQLQRFEVVSTPKAGTPHRVRFSGYVGTLRYQGNFNYYLPILSFAQKLGVGNHSTYGVGDYWIVKPKNEN